MMNLECRPETPGDPATHTKKRKQCFKVLGRIDEMSEKRARHLLRDAIVADSGLTGDGDITFKAFTKSVWTPLHSAQWRPGSKETILNHLENLYETFGSLGLTSIDPVMLQMWLDEQATRRSASAVKMLYAYVRSIFDEATHQDYGHRSP